MNGEITWMKLKPQINGNDMLLWISDTNKDLFILIWDGDTDTFGNCTNPSDNVGAIYDYPAETFDLAWETNSGDGMVVWGGTSDFSYITFSGGSWSGTGTVVAMGNQTLKMEIAADLFFRLYRFYRER